jgi:ribosomal protein S18 acetylase RimI-like enzyme
MEKNMYHSKIRKLRADEIGVLDDLLYEAIFQPDESNLLPRDIIKQPELSVYTDHFGKADDCCLIAEVNGKIAGAVWTRILTGNVKGYGNIDDSTPEFAIALFKEYRNQGIGTQLMKAMILHLQEKGYKQTSLSVAKDNYAFKMYKKLGFKIIAEQEHDYLMVLQLK